MFQKRQRVFDIINGKGYCIPNNDYENGTITWICPIGEIVTSLEAPINKVQAKSVILDENNRPMLNRTVGDFMIALQADVEPHKIA